MEGETQHEKHNSPLFHPLPNTCSPQVLFVPGCPSAAQQCPAGEAPVCPPKERQAQGMPGAGAEPIFSGIETYLQLCLHSRAGSDAVAIAVSSPSSPPCQTGYFWLLFSKLFWMKPKGRKKVKLDSLSSPLVKGYTRESYWANCGCGSAAPFGTQ